MQPECDLAVHFRQAVSPARLSGYADPGDADLMPAVCRYVWNTALCEALYPSIHGVEVALRNTIDTNLRAELGEMWFDVPTNILITEQFQTLSDSRVRLQRKGLPDTHDRIVSELSFGFWTGMLAQPYERFWQTRVTAVFPLIPRFRRTRSSISSRLNDVRALRNRASHHESVWRRPHLAQEYAAVVETLGWFSPAMESAVQVVDRFPSTLAAGPAHSESAIRALGAAWRA